MNDKVLSNPWSMALADVGTNLRMAAKEARLAYEFAPSSYTATALAACRGAADAYQRWQDLQQMCQSEPKP